MLFYMKFILLTVLIVANGNEDKDKTEEKLDKIASSISGTGKILQKTKTMIVSSSPDFTAALETVESFTDLGGEFFPELKIFSSSIGLLTGLINEEESESDKISKELSEIKESIQHVETMISGLVPQIRKDIIKQRFIQNIQHTVNDMQWLYNEFAQRPTLPQKEALTEQCHGNKMTNVLTQIHDELVNGGEGYYSELLEGGERREMTDAEKWAKGFQGLYMQATFLSSVCFPLLRTEPGWEDDLSFQMDNYRKDFEQMNEAIKKKLTELKDNFLANGKAALPEYLNLPGNWPTGHAPKQDIAYNYLNDNFNPGQGLKWNVIVISDEYINFVNPALIRIDKDKWSLIAGYGKLSKQGDCSECYDIFHINCKDLFCQKIGDIGLSYYKRSLQMFGLSVDFFRFDTGYLDGCVDYS